MSLNFPSQKEQIDNGMAGAIDESVLRTDDFIKETRIKAQLLEISNIVSLSYIAKKYFQKTRTWLYQKINGNKVNGKPACFTSEEIETFNLALQEISKKIGSTVVSL
jgi:hypothetical protein